MKRKIIVQKMLLIIPVLFLLILGCLNTYGASFTSKAYSFLYVKQIMMCIVSLVVYFIFTRINNEFIYKYSLLFYILGIISLVLVLFLGVNINGASSWFKIKSISIQPSEIFKPFYLIYLSFFLKEKKKDKKYYLKLGLIIFIPVVLIFIEPDSGVAAMYILMSLGAVIASKKNNKTIIIIISIILLIISLSIYLYVYKKDWLFEILPSSFFYRIDRLLKNDTYQIRNALVGMGSSGVEGHGIRNIKVYVPEMISDFAFSLLIMNFGYLMGILVVFIYSFLIWNVYKVLTSTKSMINKRLLSGMLFMMFFQCAEHIFMNLGITPITGITLPFLSYGGSSSISYAILFSLIIKITTNSSSYN